MAGDWIKMRSELDTDPDVVRTSVRTGLDEFAVVGRLHKLWSWADKHSTNGSLRVNSGYIDRLVACPGFSDALVDIGWLRVRHDSLELPEWSRHNGLTAKARAGEAARKRSQRTPNDGAKTPLADVRTNVRTNVPKMSGPEKRREEKSSSSSNEEEGAAVPVNLQTPTFAAAWEAWFAYRKSAKLKRLAPVSIAQQLKKLGEMGHDQAIAAINESIANGWHGIFPPKTKMPEAAPAQQQEVEKW